MMNYGNEWNMDLILSYVGTQIWGTEENHVLLLTSRKSCSVTSRGKPAHAGSAGWDVAGARSRARPGWGELSAGALGFWVVAVRHPLARLAHCSSAELREGVGSTPGHSEVNDHCGKKQWAPKQYDK